MAVVVAAALLARPALAERREPDRERPAKRRDKSDREKSLPEHASSLARRCPMDSDRFPAQTCRITPTKHRKLRTSSPQTP
jgi:hypothetical protein